MLREFLTYSQLGRRQRGTRQQILEYQSARLCKLVEHAYRNVPYYQRLFDKAGVKPAQIRRSEDLRLVPPTSKADVHATPGQDFIVRGVDPGKLVVRTSGGSTGEPIRIQRTWAEERLLNAFRFRALKTLGLRTTDLRVYIGLLRGNQKADHQSVAKAVFKTGLMRFEVVDVLLPVEEVVKRLEQLKPQVITGYAGAIAHAAYHINEHGGQPVIRPRLVVSSAEVLTPRMKSQIAEAFRAPVYNIYGANEVNIAAWECPKTGEMHTTDDLAIIEVLRDNVPVEPGQRGEVIVTNLHSWAMPIIRFRLTDVVTRGSDQCSCGLPFGTIRAVQGRLIDYFPLPDGRLLHPYEFFDKIIRDRAEWAGQYQFIQERPDLIRLRVAASRMPTPQRLEQIRSDAARLLGDGVEFQFDLVPEIKQEPSGKFRTARSLVRSAYDGIDWQRVSSGDAQ
jgi:phenylacetate-CoA ligase